MLDRLEWTDRPERTAHEIMARLLRVDDEEHLASLDIGPTGRRIPRQRRGGVALFGSANPIAYWPN